MKSILPSLDAIGFSPLMLMGGNSNTSGEGYGIGNYFGRVNQNIIDSNANQAAGYSWDPVAKAWTRTPSSAGGRAGTYVGAFNQAAGIPSISGLMSGMGGPGGTGAGGSTNSTGGGGGFGTGAGSTTGVGTSSGVGGVSGGGYTAQQPTLQMPDPTKATEAAFATAKDQAGNTARASLNSLNNELASQGLIGSGSQAAGTRDIISAGQGQLGEAARSEAEGNLETARQFATTGYQGGIAQRGQDIGAQVAERGQNVQAQEAQARLAFEQTQAAYQRNIQLLGLALGGLGSGAAGGGSAYGPGSNPYSFGG